MTTLAAPPQTLNATLIEALERDQPESALEHAFLQLSRGANLPLVLALLKAFVRAGLAGLGSRLLQSSSGLLTAEPQIASLADRLASLPSGEWSREAVLKRRKANSELLRASHPQLSGLIDSLSSKSFPFRVFESAKGNRHAIRDDCGSRLEFVFPFVDQQLHAAAAKLPSDSLSASFLLLGLPSAALWNRLLSIRSSGGYEPPIDILEPDASILEVWLGLIDPTPYSADRVSLFVGADCVERYQQFLLDHSCRSFPSHCTINARARWNPPRIDRSFAQTISTARSAAMRDSRVALEERYRGRDTRYWHKRFCTAVDAVASEPLRVVGFTNRYSTVIQHVMRDLRSAFERRGHAFRLVTQPNTSCATIDVAAQLEQNECDLIVVINHLRSEYAGAIPGNIPYVCWIQDHMEALWDANAGQSVGDLDLVVGHAPQFMSQLYGYPVDRFLASSNLTDSSTYSDAPVAECDKGLFQCDVSYVSHASGAVDDLIQQIATGSVAPFRRMLEHVKAMIVQRFRDSQWVNSTELVEMMLSAERESGMTQLTPELRRTRIYPQIARVYDRMFRHQTLEWVARWAQTRGKTFKLFGQGWEQHATLREFACGEVPSGYELRCLCQASAINLQVNGYSSLHQRMLDAISSGGFVLSRFNPADFARLACERVQQRIRGSFLRNLNELWSLRCASSDVDADCAELERLCGLRIAPAGDEVRARHCELVRASNGMADWLTDEGLFNALVTMKFMPGRVAADLPGFEQTTFKSEPELHALLDRFIESDSAREAIAASMREAIRRHDTYDSLVERILRHFSGGDPEQ